ncbi:MAG: restriction endonuclease [Bacteroidetes bacterium]|nr:MAG: restriction endonuclease [Bacteroidota bacterium]
MDWLEKISKIKSWRRGDDYAPHKPLLLLLALGALRQNKELRWSEVNDKLSQLLRKYGGKSGLNPRPLYPFIRLQNDELWVVEGFIGISGDAKKSDLDRVNPIGYLEESFADALSKNDKLFDEIVGALISQFPETLIDDILVDVQLSQVSRQFVRSKRDPKFRHEVLDAYDRACAICGNDIRVGDVTVGVEAAHIKPHAADGPCEISNGIALCLIHHKLFDRGAIGFNENMELLISERVNGIASKSLVWAYDGQSANLPHKLSQKPDLKYLAWHQKNILQL